MIPFVPWFVYLVADKKGYWEREGIPVEVMMYPDERGYVKDIEEKKSDLYPLPLSSVLELYNQNDPFYCTGFLDQANGHKQIIVKQDHAGHLKNTAIAIYSDEIATRYFLARYLSTQGLKLYDVHLVFVDSKTLFETYLDPNISACLVFGVDFTPLLEVTDSRVVYTTGDYTEPFTLAVPAEKYSQDMANHFSRIVKGRMRAVDWINKTENSEEFCSLVNQFMVKGLREHTADEVFKLYNQLTHPTLYELEELNNKTRSIFSDLTKTCLANQIISEETARTFTPENVVVDCR